MFGVPRTSLICTWSVVYFDSACCILCEACSQIRNILTNKNKFGLVKQTFLTTLNI